jgi:hypothetical protein
MICSPDIQPADYPIQTGMVFGNLKSANDCPFSHLFVVYEWHGEQHIFLLPSPFIPVLRKR